jgi:hypothetical protein
VTGIAIRYTASSAWLVEYRITPTPHGREGGVSGLALGVCRPPELRSTSRLASIFSGKALRKRR